uniref:Si:ch73-345f18.3 n=1 Tax=Oryzias latipes TaxID=8090 RepID=A0A3B3HPF1_ORYLA
QNGRLLMRRVNVPELDERFADLAQTFNDHQEGYETMVERIRNLQKGYDCTRCDHMSLAECVGKIMQEWIKGYDFSLSVVPVSLESETEEEPLPPGLQHTQNEVRYISDGAKATISKSTTLQELTSWLLRSQSTMIEQVHEAAENYQEQGRLKENLKENMIEVRRAQRLIQEYKQRAGEVLT